MTDKEKILAEIKRRMKNNQQDATESGAGAFYEDKELLSFIHSLPTEQPSEDLQEASYNAALGLMINPDFPPKPLLGKFVFMLQGLFMDGANWQKEQMMKGLCYETKVYRDEEGDGIDTPIESWLALENNEITNLPNIGLKDGNKVKVIIVKENEH